MAASGEERIRQLTQRMLRKKLYVILSKGGATAEQIGALLPQHLEYMIGLEKQGVLFASGPLTAAPGAPQGDGLTILRAGSADEARSHRFGRSVRRQQAAQLRGARVDVDGGLVRREGEFLRPVARHRVTKNKNREREWKP